MTHSLHRRGNEAELENDFVVLAMGARGVNRDGCAPKIQKILDIMVKHNPTNYSNVFTGNAITSNIEEMRLDIRDNTVAHAVFNTEEDLTNFLKEVKEEDIGISIIVSGLFDHVHECCNKSGLEPHTVNTSLGIHGKTELLPEEPILEIATMCGHSMISFNLIKKMVEDIKQGRTTALKAAKIMAANCHCGIFNWERAEKIITKLSQE